MNERTCPAAGELRAFLNAELDAQHEERISQHIDQCQRCNEALTIVAADDETDSGADALPVLEALRVLPSSEGFVSEALCKDAIQRAREIPNSSIDSPQTPNSVRTNAAPDQLGPYCVENQIGFGGMGTVYRATHTKLNRTVAIKVLHGRRLSHPTAVARFEREMKAVGQLEHPNIVRATDADEEDGVQYLVMEYLDGIDLSSLVRQRGPLPISEACELVHQAALGLQHAHSNGFVHRDVKPANLMLWRGNSSDRRISPVVKVLDLGLAVVDAPESEEALTSTGQAVGTVEYMAPEQVDETQQVDIRADIYSLGATLCRLLTGLTRFEAANQTSQRQKLKGLATEDAPSVGSYFAGLPRKLVSIADRMLATDPDRRYSTPQEVADALQPFCEGADLDSLFDTVNTVGAASYSTISGVNLRGSQAKTARKRPKKHLWTIGLCVIGAVLATYAAIVIQVRSPEGTIVLKFDDPRLIGSVVTIDDENIVTINDANYVEPLTIAADGKERALKIVRGGIAIFTQKVIIKPDETQPVAVTWEPLPASEDSPSPNGPRLAIAPFTADEAAKHQQAWANHLASRVELENSIGMAMRLIPPGEFLMGASPDDPDAQGYEKPQHRVRLTRPFWIGETEVTVSQFRAFVEDTKYVTQAESDGGGAFGPGGLRYEAEVWDVDWAPEADAYPVRNVSWTDATKFCEWLTEKEGRAYRLPTEAEWEFSCRAGTSTRYHFGEEFASSLAAAWVDDTPLRIPRHYPPNAFGLYDMHGNVHEACLDTGRTYSDQLAIDPVGGVETAETVVIRGGAISSNPTRLRSSHRYLNDNRSFPAQDFANRTKGFRVVMVPGDPPAADGEVPPESMIVEAGWRVKQVVEFEERVDAAVLDPHDGTLYCVIYQGDVLAVAFDGTRRTVLEQFAGHPTIAFERRAIFHSVPPSGNLLGAIDLEDGTEVCSINCSEGDNDISTIAFAPLGFVPELLGSHQGLVLDVGFNNPIDVFRFNWQTSEAESVVDNPEILRCPEGALGDLTIGRDTVYLSNSSRLFRLEGRTLVRLPVEMPEISDIAFDPVTNDLLVQSGEGVKRVDPAGKRPVRDVFRGIEPAWENRLRFSADGTEVVLCDITSRRVYVFTRDDL